MSKSRTNPPPKGPDSRDDRLRAALRANLGRRKAQARARKAHETENEEGDQADTAPEHRPQPEQD